MQENNNAGLSIVEALVTMVILMITLGGVYQIFQSSSLTYRMQEGLARVQENGRFAMDFLANDIRMAGYRGCNMHGDVESLLNNIPGYLYDFHIGVLGYNDMTTSLGDINRKTGTDAILIRRIGDVNLELSRVKQPARVYASYVSGMDGVCSDGSSRFSGICKGDILMLSDCAKTRIFQVTNIQNTGSYPNQELNIVHDKTDPVECGNGDENAICPGNYLSSWGGEGQSALAVFGMDSELLLYSTIVYYIHENGGLYRKVGQSQPQEIVEGVDFMRIVYGISDHDSFEVNDYYDANDVTDWDMVRSVKIGLLVKSAEEIRLMDETSDIYSVLGTEIGPAKDRHVRRVFTATIGLRNRLK